MAVADLHDPGAKFWWADKHLQRLDRRIAKFNEANSNSSGVQIGSNHPWYIIRITPFPPLPEEFVLCVGDFLTNIRAVLDHLVWQLVLREGKKPKYTHSFPIMQTEKEFINKVKSPPKEDEKRSPLYGIPVSGDAWTIIENAQPYKSPSPKFDYLALLSKFVNMDKHRTLLVRNSVIDPTSIEDFIGWRLDTQPIERIESFAYTSHEEPTEIIRYRFASDPGMYMKRAIPVQPTFGDGKTMMNIGTLQRIRFKVGEILNDIGELSNVEGLG